MKNAIIASLLLASSFAACAVEANGTGVATGVGTGGNIGSITVEAPVAAPQLPHTSADIKYKGAGQYTAPSGPSTFGAVGGNGCPVLETKSGAIFVANYGQAVAREMPGCMGLLLAAFLGQLNPANDGTITFKEQAGLSALCDFPQYRARLKSIGYRYGGKPWMCAEDQPVAQPTQVGAQRPQPWQAGG